MSYLKTYLLQFILIIFSTFILSVPIVVLEIYYPHKIYAITDFLTAYFWVFTVFRLLLMGLIFASWHKFIQYVSVKYQWTEAKTQFWREQRFRVVMWFILIELFFNIL
jgi:hypothetical protein